jgi:hypothetical protein
MSVEDFTNFNTSLTKKKENPLTQEQSFNIDEVFKDNPEVAKIFNNNKELYQEYLDSIFPESKFKGIYFHGSPNLEIEKFLSPEDEEYKQHENTTTGATGVHFADNYEEAKKYSKWNEGENGRIYSVVLNIQKFFTVSDNIMDGMSEGLSKANLWHIQQGMLETLKKNNIDAFVAGEYMVRTEGFREISMVDINKIHILGSQKDLEQAKKWVESNKR